MHIVVHDTSGKKMILILGHGDKVLKTDKVGKTKGNSMVEYSILSKSRDYLMETVEEVEKQLIFMVRDADAGQ